MVEKLSPREEQILSFITDTIAKKGFPPSVREIGKAVGLASPSSVYAHLQQLEKKGILRRQKGKKRALEVIHPLLQAPKVIKVPIVGSVAAGQPILAQENIEGYFPLPADFVTGEVFLLKVKGDSMQGAGIFPGDYAIVRRQNEVQNGDIAVVLLENEATLKRFYQEKDQVRLQPENPLYSPILLSHVHVLGRVVGLIRRI